jgi:hypothetical protein
VGKQLLLAEYLRIKIFRNSGRNPPEFRLIRRNGTEFALVVSVVRAEFRVIRQKKLKLYKIAQNGTKRNKKKSRTIIVRIHIFAMPARQRRIGLGIFLSINES